MDETLQQLRTLIREVQSATKIPLVIEACAGMLQFLQQTRTMEEIVATFTKAWQAQESFTKEKSTSIKVMYSVFLRDCLELLGVEEHLDRKQVRAYVWTRKEEALEGWMQHRKDGIDYADIWAAWHEIDETFETDFDYPASAVRNSVAAWNERESQATFRQVYEEFLHISR